MPIASRFVTAAEWQAIEKEHNLDPKSMSELGFEGHWLIDGANDDRPATVHRARATRSRGSSCCTASPGDTGGTPRRAGVEARSRRAACSWRTECAVTVDADIDEVWDVVRDVTRVGEWSHECVGAAWLGGATSAVARRPVPGPQPRRHLPLGTGVRDRLRRPVRARVAHRPHRRCTPTAREWRITLERLDDGTRISQHFRVLRAPKALAVLYALVIPAHRDRTAALVEDLQRLGAVATGDARMRSVVTSLVRDERSR